MHMLLAFEYKLHTGKMAVYLAAELEAHLEVSNNKCVNLHRLNLRGKIYRCGNKGMSCVQLINKGEM